MLSNTIRKIALRFLTVALLTAAAYACNCTFTTITTSDDGTGFLAQASVSSDYCWGWTLARYAVLGTPITANVYITGRFCSNGQTDPIVDGDEVTDDYILAENYWNFSTQDVHDKGRCKVIKTTEGGSNQAQAFVDP